MSNTLVDKIFQEIDAEEKVPDQAVSPSVSSGTTQQPQQQEAEEEDEGFSDKKNPPVPEWVPVFAGHDFDTFIVVWLIIFIWVLIWWKSGLVKTVGFRRGDPVFTLIFILFPMYMILNIFTAGRTSGGVVYELNILLTVEQMISILFGTIVVFALFRHNIETHPNCKPVISQIVLSVVTILTLASLWVNVWTTGRAFRAVRKFKQGVYNVSLSLFILVILIMIRANC